MDNYNTMFETIINNDNIDNIKTNIITELEGKDLDKEQITHALLASTSAGFNDLFSLISKMTVNANILEDHTDNLDVVIDETLQSTSANVINIIYTIAKAINNKDIKVLTENLNTLMQQQQVEVDEQNATDVV